MGHSSSFSVRTNWKMAPCIIIGRAADELMMNCDFALWNIQQRDKSHLDPVLEFWSRAELRLLMNQPAGSCDSIPDSPPGPFECIKICCLCPWLQRINWQQTWLNRLILNQLWLVFIHLFIFVLRSSLVIIIGLTLIYPFVSTDAWK